MPTLKRFSSCRVLIFNGDHPPPHVHVKLSNGRDCTVELHSFEIKGKVAERDIREALDWIRSNQNFLFDEWQRNNP
ncbi:DUF4160 domain-containing protein [Desulfonatronum parangueonense]